MGMSLLRGIGLWVCCGLVLVVLAGCGVVDGKDAVSVVEPAETTVPTTVPETTEPTVVETTEATVPTETTVPVTEPEETTPATEPVVTEPEETEPEVTEPQKPTEPKPTDPPKPTEPKPTEPPKTHTHSYKAKVVEPTCEEKGYTKHTCSCGDSYTDSEKPALGHDMYEEVSEPGPGYEGYTHHYCSRCNYSYTDNYTEALPEVTAADVEKAIVKYINQYRAEQGSTQLTYLPGMTNVAKYRSKQLTTNFAHDTDDIREAHNYYKYGKYMDWAEAGCPELVDQNYYASSSQEAISRGYGIWGTADEIAEEFARGFRDSSGHWRYVGSSEYSYIGVGVTQHKGEWFVCVMVGRVNYG